MCVQNRDFNAGANRVTMHLFQTRIRIRQVLQGQEPFQPQIPAELRDGLVGLELYTGPIEPSGVVYHCDTFTGFQQPIGFAVHRVNKVTLMLGMDRHGLGDYCRYFYERRIERRPFRIDEGFSWFRADEVEIIEDQPELWISRFPGAVIHRQRWTEEGNIKHPLVFASCCRCELGYPKVLAESASEYALRRYMPAGYALYPGPICLTREAIDELLVDGEEKVCKHCLSR